MEQKMKVVYVAGPYRASNIFKQIHNIRRARRYARLMWWHGIVALCPHSNSAFFDDIDDIILPGCIELMLRCDAMFVIPDSDKSSGVKAEIAAARHRDMPIYTELHKLFADVELDAITKYKRR